MESITGHGLHCLYRLPGHLVGPMQSAYPLFHESLREKLSENEPGTFDRWLEVATCLSAASKEQLHSAVSPVVSGTGSPTLAIPSVSGSTTPRNAEIYKNCLTRDDSRCVITGHSKRDNLSVEVAHVIPWALSNRPECRQEPFWKTIEIFYGPESTNHIWSLAGGENVNNLSNLVTLSVGFHRYLDAGGVHLWPYLNKTTPYEAKHFLQDPFYPVPLAYYVKVMFMRNTTPGIFTTTKVMSQGEATLIRDGDMFLIETQTTWPLPHPLLFICRRRVDLILRSFRRAIEPMRFDAYPDSRGSVTSDDQLTALDPEELVERLGEISGGGVCDSDQDDCDTPGGSCH